MEKRRRRRKVVLLRKRLGLSEHSFWNKVSVSRLHFSIEGGYPEIEYDRRAIGDSTQVKVRTRNGVTFRSPLCSTKDSTVCGSEMGGQPYLNRDRADRPIRARAANNDARQGVDDPLDIER